MHALSYSTWTGAALLAAALAVSCGPSVTVSVSSDATSGIATSGAGAGGAQTTATGSGGAGTGGACAGHVYYADKLDDAPSVWEWLQAADGMTGLAAGNSDCLVLSMGGDHVCDYEEVLLAQAQGELALVPQGTTAWVQRTTTALVNGKPSAPGPGGNCDDWTYDGFDVASGEHVTFDQTGVPTFHLVADTTLGVPLGSEMIPPELYCINVKRSLLCCHPACQ